MMDKSLYSDVLNTSERSFGENSLYSIRNTLSQYPILSDKMIASMYNRLVEDGYITINLFEEKVREHALNSQRREGLENPFAQESQNTWEKRLRIVHRNLVIQDFSQYYGKEDFDTIVQNTIQNKASKEKPKVLWHTIQYFPVHVLVEQAQMLENLPSTEKKAHQGELMGTKAAIIRRVLSVNPDYIDIARKIFSVNDLIEIDRMRIGRGPIGSKAAGVLLCNRILRNSSDADVRNAVSNIDSICIGSEEFSHFMFINDLIRWFDLKYSDEETIWNCFAELQADFMKGDFAEEIVNSIRDTLTRFAGRPFIIRSSSLMEDSFTRPFNSMYESAVLLNQGTPEENLQEVLDAIRRIYASTFSPNALIYRKKNHLLDFEERVGILIQVLPGERYGSYFFPTLSGSAYSISPYSWTQDDKDDDGFLRFSIGLTSRTSYRTGDDFANIVIFSHPDLRHTSFTKGEERLAQHSIHVLNLKSNMPEILDINDIVDPAYPAFHLLAQRVEEDGQLYSLKPGENPDRCLFTCQELIKKTGFTRMIQEILTTLRHAYGRHVNIQFSAMIDVSDPRDPQFRIQIHNCHPVKNRHRKDRILSDPNPCKRDLFTSDLFTDNGRVDHIDYVVFVDPNRYFHLFGKEKDMVSSVLSDINKILKNEKFVFAAAGRWGTREGRGIPVQFQDISNAQALIELSGWDAKQISDPFVGTQFFRSIFESKIYSIITNADRPDDIDRSFFTDMPEQTDKWIELPEKLRGLIRILPTAGWYGSSALYIEMNADLGITRAYFN